MKTIMIISTILSLLLGHPKGDVNTEICNTNLCLIVNLKNVSIDKTPEFQFREGGLRVPVSCAVYISKNKKRITLALVEDYKHLMYEVVDTFSFTTSALDFKPTILNINIMKKDFLLYTIPNSKETIAMIFTNEDLDFALQLIDNIKLIECVAD